MAASYPSAVKTFASRSAGQVIDPSHVNDLQDEVNAIEAGLLNGTATLTSSNAHVQALQADLNSTIHNLTVSSNLSVTGQLTQVATALFQSSVVVNGTLTLASTSYLTCRVSHGANQNIETATATGLSFNQEHVNPQSMHSTAANSSRIVLVRPGTWLLGACVNFASTGGTYRDVSIYINDTTIIAQIVVPPLAGSASVLSVTGTYYSSVATDYATVRVAHDRGSSMNALAQAPAPSFWATSVGA